ncbi:MAG: glycosyltransferase family 9 protein [Ignavibacterium sp.]|nr:MAG: glycosyltransferase family 9 protein [Ignavibacterium sp.]
MNLENVNNLLIVRLSSLGDILLVTPLIRTIKNKYPGIDIDFVVRDEYKDVLKLNPHLRDVYIFHRDNNKIKELTSKVCNNKYDLVIDLQNNIRSHRLLSCFGDSVVKYKKLHVKKFLLILLKINLLKDTPQIPARYASVLDNFILDKQGPELFTDKPPYPKLSDANKLIGICPGSKHFTKMWPEEYFIQLGKTLEKNGFNVVLFGGSDDKEICKRISSILSSAINLSNNNDILQTAADMKICDVIYCNDSGLMHTATAVGVPVIAFYGSTVKEFGFIPYNAKNLILENISLSCRPCTHIGRGNCPKRHFKCMKEISPQSAYEKLKSITV